jgi:hypothetical protein
MNHQFITVKEFDEGSTEAHVSCLICGGVWQVAGDGKSSGASARGMTGDLAVDCRGLSTSRDGACHHYADECASDTCDIDPECNCLYCYS